MAVYTKNRLLRTPLSCKLEDATKTALSLLQPWCGTGITDAFVTNVPADLPLIMPRENVGRAISARKAQSATSGAGQGVKIAPSQATSRVLNEVVQELQAMLDAAGSKGCEVTTHALPPGPSGAQSIICKNMRTRVCLVSDGEEHVHNNAWLNVHEDGSVFYHCHAAGCKTKRPKHIGSLDRDLLMEQYDSSESSVACTMEVDHEDSGSSSSPCDGVLHDCSSACPSTSTSSSSSRAQLNFALHTAVIRELALMGPVDKAEEAHTVLVTCVGSQGCWWTDSRLLP